MDVCYTQHGLFSHYISCISFGCVPSLAISLFRDTHHSALRWSFAHTNHMSMSVMPLDINAFATSITEKGCLQDAIYAVNTRYIQ